MPTGLQIKLHNEYAMPALTYCCNVYQPTKVLQNKFRCPQMSMERAINARVTMMQ